MAALACPICFDVSDSGTCDGNGFDWGCWVPDYMYSPPAPYDTTLYVLPSGPFEAIQEGTWGVQDNMLKLTSNDGELYTFYYEVQDGNLTLDRSLIGQEDYITNWEIE